MVQMAFCDLSHTYHKQVTDVSPACFCHPTVGNFDISPKATVKAVEQNTEHCPWHNFDLNIILRIDYCGLGPFYAVPVFSLYKIHCLMYFLLLYTTKKTTNKATS